MLSIQDRVSPDGTCYGCGPANDRGLGLRSFLVDGVVAATWQPLAHHGAAPGMLCGGVIGTLMDCHSGAALSQAVKDHEGAWPWSEGPGWATAEYTVRMRRPTPTEPPLRLSASSASLDGDRAHVTVELVSDGELRATCTAIWRRLRAS